MNPGMSGGAPLLLVLPFVSFELAEVLVAADRDGVGFAFEDGFESEGGMPNLHPGIRPASQNQGSLDGGLAKLSYRLKKKRAVSVKSILTFIDKEV